MGVANRCENKLWWKDRRSFSMTGLGRARERKCSRDRIIHSQSIHHRTHAQRLAPFALQLLVDLHNIRRHCRIPTFTFVPAAQFPLAAPASYPQPPPHPPPLPDVRSTYHFIEQFGPFLCSFFDNRPHGLHRSVCSKPTCNRLRPHPPTQPITSTFSESRSHDARNLNISEDDVCRIRQRLDLTAGYVYLLKHLSTSFFAADSLQ